MVVNQVLSEYPLLNLNLKLMICDYILVFLFVFYVGHPKQSIFLTTIYGLYFSLHYTHYKLHFFHDIDLLWAAFNVLHQHLYVHYTYDSMWLHDSGLIKGT